MRGGDDQVEFSGGAPDGRFDGGEGNDRFVYTRIDEHDERLPDNTSILFDLSTGRLKDTWAGGETIRRAVDFEKTRVYTGFPGGPVTIKGTRGPDVLKATKAPVVVTILGRGGDDRILGSWGDDVLIGRPGNDAATGKSGSDECDAEIRSNCEF